MRAQPPEVQVHVVQRNSININFYDVGWSTEKGGNRKQKWDMSDRYV